MKIIYVPCANEEEATSISTTLVSEKLAACTNIFPIKSIYQWKGKLESEKEYVIIVKTTDALESEAVVRIKELHSYETPAIISWNSESNSEYFDWMKEQVK